MSYAFDTLVMVWRKRVDPLIEDRDLATAFEMLFQEMHSANHKVNLPTSRISGDGVNKDVQVSRAARQLEECDYRLEEKREVDARCKQCKHWVEGFPFKAKAPCFCCATTKDHDLFEPKSTKGGGGT